MKSVIIDQEFKFLMPPLSKQTRELLEENLMEHGCRDSLVLWQDILIDGHNRYEICIKHGIPFNTVQKDFASREEALIWIIANQVSRRNLSPIQLSHFRGLHYRAEKRRVTNTNGKNQYSEVVPQNGAQPKKEMTAARIGEHYNVSRNTINRDARIADAIDAIGEVSPDAKTMILEGEVKLEKKILEALAAAPKDEIADIARSIEEGTYVKNGDSPPVPRSSVPNPAVPQTKSKPIAPEAMEKTVSGYVTGAQYRALLDIAKTGDAKQVKAALTDFIDMLVVLYKQL